MWSSCVSIDSVSWARVRMAWSCVQLCICWMQSSKMAFLIHFSARASPKRPESLLKQISSKCNKLRCKFQLYFHKILSWSSKQAKTGYKNQQFSTHPSETNSRLDPTTGALYSFFRYFFIIGPPVTEALQFTHGLYFHQA